MYTLEQLQEKLKQTFAKEIFRNQPEELYEPIAYTMEQGGKRIRPLLMLLACDMFGGDVDKVMSPAIGLEIFHNFTLLHDDIMDKSPLRRGKETVYQKWNTNIAILSGDTMFALGYKYFLEENFVKMKEMLSVFTKTAIEVCEGQQYDMNFEKMHNVGIADYMKMIRLKTAVLLACALSVGALSAGACEKDTKFLYDFGIEIGLAFQLQDDLLDCFGDTEVFGKMTGTDIADNKKTFLYLKALELADNETKIGLKQLFETPGMPHKEKEGIVKAVYEKLDIRQITLNEINRLTQNAIQLLEAIALPSERKSALRQLVEKLVGRHY